MASRFFDFIVKSVPSAAYIYRLLNSASHSTSRTKNNDIIYKKKPPHVRETEYMSIVFAGFSTDGWRSRLEHAARG